jgi:hypothetical protein
MYCYALSRVFINISAVVLFRDLGKILGREGRAIYQSWHWNGEDRLNIFILPSRTLFQCIIYIYIYIYVCVCVCVYKGKQSPSIFNAYGCAPQAEGHKRRQRDDEERRSVEKHRRCTYSIFPKDVIV